MTPEATVSANYLADHLWQSTVFAGVAGLLTLLLRKNRARVRLWVWLAASFKFLIPFVALIALGSHIGWRRTVATSQSGLSFTMDEVSQPFTALTSPSPVQTAPPARNPLPEILLGVWAIGFIGISYSWLVRWRRIRAAVRAGSPLQLEIPVRAVSSPTFLEPGVYGIFRPVLFLPEGIFDRLTPAQLRSVIAHELCHVRHRDNLVASIQMFVETVFWFHPLVWWIGKRMVEERERACDEDVLRMGGDPRVYAEGILKVCQFYLESPVACVSGVTGSDLKKRMERIMRKQTAEKLRGWKKAFLTIAGVTALAVPVIAGAIAAPRRQGTAPATTGDQPKYDVVSVKENKSRDTRVGGSGTQGGRLNRTNILLSSLITGAYGRLIRPQWVAAGWPEWVLTTRYDIAAEEESNPNPTPEQNQQMLQVLLADRFKLAAHWENRELPVYALELLTPGKLGPQLWPHTDDSKCLDPSSPAPPPFSPAQVDGVLTGSIPLPTPRCGFFTGTPMLGHLVAQKVPIDGYVYGLVAFLTGSSDRWVIDRTGLTGTYDLKLEFAPPQPLSNGSITGPDINADPGGPPTLSTALKEQLGLKLVPTTGPMPLLIIDHIEQPTPN